MQTIWRGYIHNEPLTVRAEHPHIMYSFSRGVTFWLHLNCECFSWSGTLNA
jgi:hypothetical protein